MSEIECHCALCGEKLHLSSELSGRMTQCPKCLRVVPVPGDPAGARDSEGLSELPAEVLSLDVEFRCRHCGANLVVDGRWEGRTVDCPKCKAPVSIPLWSGRPPVGREAVRAIAALSQDEIHFLSAAPELQTR